MRLSIDNTQAPYDVREILCPICKKKFFKMSALWAYTAVNPQTKTRSYFCSWRCLREAEKAPRLSRSTRERPRLSREEKYIMQAMFDAKYSTREVAEALSVTGETIYYHRKKIKKDGSNEKRNKEGVFTAYCTDESACIGCAMCAMMCPDCAIVVEK